MQRATGTLTREVELGTTGVGFLLGVAFSLGFVFHQASDALVQAERLFELRKRW